MNNRGFSSRFVWFTVVTVVLAGVLSASAALFYTYRLSHVYNETVLTGLEEKALAYGVTAQAFLDELGPDAYPAVQAISGSSANDDSSEGGSSRFGNEFQTIEVWLPDSAAPSGFRLLERQVLTDAETTLPNQDVVGELLASVRDNAEGAGAAVDPESRVMLTSVTIPLGDDTALIVATLSAEDELALFAAQRRAAVIGGIIVSVAIIAGVSIAAGGLSVLLVRQRRRAEASLRFTQFATDRSSVPAFWMDSEARFFYVNDAACSVLGYSRDELLTMTAYDISPDVPREGLAKFWEQLRAQGSIEGTFHYRAKDGSTFPVEVTANYVQSDGKEYVCAFARDITERTQAEEALRQSEEKYRQFFENVQDIYFQTELDGTIIELSPSVERFGYPRHQLIGTSVLDIYADPDERNAFVQALLKNGEVIDYELHLKAGDGRVVPASTSARIRRNEEGEPICMEGALRDISERKQAEDALREQARRDPLTGALNHAAIVDELRELLGADDGTASHAVVMCDVDGLKAVNDTYGHQVGDSVLIAVAQTLSSRDDAAVGRYGGDEFVAVLRGADRQAAEQYRDAVLEALAGAGLTEPQAGSPVPVAASIGVAVYPDEADTIDDLIRLSDSAMYAARRQRHVAPGAPNAVTSGSDRASQMVEQLLPLLASPTKLDDKIKLVAQRISAGAGYDAVNIDVFSLRTEDPYSRNVYAEVDDDVIDAWRGERRPEEADPFIQLLSRTRRGIIVQDPQNDERLTETQRNVLRVAGLHSAVVVPLFLEDQLIGMLSVATKREDAFTLRDVQFLTIIATQITAIVRMSTLVEDLQSSSSRIAEAQTETVLLLAASAEAHDLTTGHHLQSVRIITEALAAQMGYDQEGARDLGLAAVLHDIGKIRVPDTILASSGKLAEEEWELMKHHTTWGEKFLAGRPGFELAAAIARSHHERWDGSGYPDGLGGDRIPKAALIVAVADSLDAMTSDRPYRPGRPVTDALEEIAACSGSQFCPDVVAGLMRLHGRGELPAVSSETSKREAA